MRVSSAVVDVNQFDSSAKFVYFGDDSRAKFLYFGDVLMEFQLALKIIKPY
uniref:Uncharacterized protein n=1 Tax=Rhizophora mucronata TaxID=61149 RepID=A0A2P2PS40_RHIMU